MDLKKKKQQLIFFPRCVLFPHTGHEDSLSRRYQLIVPAQKPGAEQDPRSKLEKNTVSKRKKNRSEKKRMTQEDTEAWK